MLRLAPRVVLSGVAVRRSALGRTSGLTTAPATVVSTTETAPSSVGNIATAVISRADVTTSDGGRTTAAFQQEYAPVPRDEAPLKPAELDAQNFRLDPSVDFWAGKPGAPTPSLMETLQMVVGDMTNPEAAAYWTYHMGRFSFFATTGVSALLYDDWRDFLAGRGGDNRQGRFYTPETMIRDQGAARAYEAVRTWRQDLGNIRTGAYRLPYDMTSLTHRQYNPLFVASRFAQFLQEGSDIMRQQRGVERKEVWMHSDLYPDYYFNDFHYQTDGWFSEQSARVYEVSTESLFSGRQDAMQRSVLPAISAFMRDREPRTTQLLEVAAGTGRLHTFIKDNYPTMPSICSDLSPFYLKAARDNVKYWKRLRQPSAPLGGYADTGVTFLQCAAERLDVADESVDIVVNVYLFHELPAEVQPRVASEMFRVLRSGGIAVICDSAQLGDRPEWDKSMGQFSRVNEPHYKDYISTDLGGMFRAAGFECDTKWMCSASKVLSFRKP